MKRNVINKAKLAFTAISLSILVLGIISCGGVKPGANIPATASRATLPSDAAIQTTGKTTSSSKSIIPKLTNVSFTLALDAGQEYTEYTSPIYIKAVQILHLNWVVVKGGDHFYMTVTLPAGSFVVVRSDGSLAAISPGEKSSEKLIKSGDIIFSPQDNKWGDGYYIFHPQIYKPDPPVTIKLLYWLE